MNHVFWAYLDHSLSDMYIGNVLLIYRTKCTLSRIKIHAQNKSDKIVFFQTARHTPFGKKRFCDPCFSSLFGLWLVRYIHRKYPTYISDKLCFKSDLKTHAKQVGYFRLIYRTNSPFGKNYTFCEPCFLSLFKTQKAWFTKRIVFSKWRPIHIGQIMV